MHACMHYFRVKGFEKREALRYKNKPARIEAKAMKKA